MSTENGNRQRPLARFIARVRQVFERCILCLPRIDQASVISPTPTNLNSSTSIVEVDIPYRLIPWPESGAYTSNPVIAWPDPDVNT